MAFVYREGHREEVVRLNGLRLESPYGGGAARFGSLLAVDKELDAAVFGLGGGAFEQPGYGAVVKGCDALIFAGRGTCILADRMTDGSGCGFTPRIRPSRRCGIGRTYGGC
jgi:hypothetical protein